MRSVRRERDRRALLMTVAAVLAAATACGMSRKPPEEPAASAAQTKEPEKVREAPVEWKGQYCGVAEPKEVLVATEEQWKRVWRDTFGEGKEVPAVDFTKQVAAAVFLGVKRTGGYGVEFLEPETRGAKTFLPYRMKSPGKGSFVIQALTQPFGIRLYEKPAGDVEFARRSP